MASKSVKERERSGEDLSGKIWTAEKPYMLVRKTKQGEAISFFFSMSDFDYAVKKAERNEEEIIYAAKIEAFQKIDQFKSGFGRNTEILDVLEID